MAVRHVMQGVAQKLLKGMTVSLVNSGLGSQFIQGAHYTKHFKGEGGYSQRRPGGNADMEDWGRSDAAMLDGKRRNKLHSLLMFRKADGLSHDRFSSWNSR